MEQLAVVSELLQIFGHHVIELTCFADKNLLHREEVPVLADRLKEIIEEIVEFVTEIVPDEDYMVTQLDLALGDTIGDVFPDLEFTTVHFSQDLLNF